MYLPIQCQLCVLYPVAVTHTVGTHHGHMIRKKFRSLHASVRTRLLVHLTQQRRRWCHLTPLGHLLGIETMSDLVPSLSFPLTDSYGGHG